MRSKQSRTSPNARAWKAVPTRYTSPHKSFSARMIAVVVVSLLVAFAIQTSAQRQNSSPSQFVDITASAGIKFTHFKGNKGVSINLEEFGPGVCVSDFDGDGWQDIYFVNGRDRYGRGISA